MKSILSKIWQYITTHHLFIEYGYFNRTDYNNKPMKAHIVLDLFGHTWRFNGRKMFYELLKG